MGKRVVSEPLLHVDWLILDGIRRVVNLGPVFGLLCGKHREYYRRRRAEMKCQTEDCYYSGILLEFQGAKVMECPIHPQHRLDKKPAHMADDLMNNRLSRKGQ